MISLLLQEILCQLIRVDPQVIEKWNSYSLTLSSFKIYSFENSTTNIPKPSHIKLLELLLFILKFILLNYLKKSIYFKKFIYNHLNIFFIIELLWLSLINKVLIQTIDIHYALFQI
jgi:hypothetical protein